MARRAKPENPEKPVDDLNERQAKAEHSRLET
jgi:hypothetical protein